MGSSNWGVLMGDLGIKIGSNLNTNTDLQLRFTSKFSSLKLYKWKDAQFTTNGSGVGSVEVTHDLGYTPIVQVWGKHTASYSFLSATTYSNAYSLIDSFNSYRPYGVGIRYHADEDKVTIETVDTGGIGGSAAASTTYYFRVLIWVDPSESFSGTSTIALNDDYGFKVSEDGVSVFDGEEYQMKYSSKYRAIQYYPNHVLTSSITLPAMWATRVDTEVTEASYIDFNHNLRFPPLFYVFSDLGGSNIYEIPYGEITPVGPNYKGFVETSAWCDSSRVRVLFGRESVSLSTNNGTEYPQTTYNFYVVISTFNLSITEN